MTATGWVEREVGTADLGDRRRTRRLVRFMGAVAAHPTGSIPAACGSWAATKAAYRLLSDEAVAPDAILAAHVRATVGRVARGAAPVLAVQDTTQLDLSAHPALAGAGALAHPEQRGLLIHSVLAVSDAGTPLGVLHQHRWTRDPDQIGVRHTRRQRPTAAKESQRWLAALAATHAALPAGAPVVSVADREADLYDLFALPRPPHSELLIRAAHNRRVDHEAGRLHDAARRSLVCGELTVTIGRRDERPARTATLTLRATPLALLPPHRRAGAPIAVVAILAEESSPPPEVDPVRWLLVSTRLDASPAAAALAVRRYATRWVIERYHYVLKQGCGVEGLQLRTMARIERALAVYAVVAWRVLWLTYLARQTPEGPCTLGLSEPEWQALCCSVQRTATPPAEPPSLRQAVRWIAQLGGFLGRRGDGDPGGALVWRGWQRLDDVTIGWRLAHLSAPPPDVGNA